MSSDSLCSRVLARPSSLWRSRRGGGRDTCSDSRRPRWPPDSAERSSCSSTQRPRALASAPLARASESSSAEAATAAAPAPAAAGAGAGAGAAPRSRAPAPDASSSSSCSCSCHSRRSLALEAGNERSTLHMEMPVALERTRTQRQVPEYVTELKWRQELSAPVTYECEYLWAERCSRRMAPPRRPRRRVRARVQRQRRGRRRAEEAAAAGGGAARRGWARGSRRASR